MLKEQITSSGKLFKWLLIGTLISTLFFQVHSKWTHGNEKTIIFSDALGYYAYLPAVFIYHDMNFGFQSEYENKYYEDGKRTNFCSDINGRKTDKYFCGVSVMLLPFFLLACLFSKIFGFNVDGYSYFFQLSVGVAALFYIICAFIFLRKLLLYYCSERSAVLIIFAFFFGTNLLYYTWMEPAMSHVYSFTAFTAFLYFTKKIFDGHKKKDIFLSVFFYGLIILIRPSNAVVILALPFLAGSFSELKLFFEKLFLSPKTLIAAALIFFSVIFIQLLIFFMETGQWIVYSYTGEKFDFAHPEIMNVLFSYRKGLFIYTPLTFISLAGIFVLMRKNKFAFGSVILFFAVSVWVISSWWCWYYGGSFGHRAFIEYFSVFAVLLAVLFHSLTKNSSKIILSGIVMLCVSLNIFQTWQYFHLIIPWDGMTKDRYWTVFLKTSERYAGIFTPNAFIPEEITGDDAVVFKNDLDPGKEWSDMNSVTDEKAHSGTHSSKIGGEVDKSVSFTKKVLDVFPAHDSTSYLQVKLWAWIESEETDAQIVISFERNGKPFDWHAYYIAQQIKNEKTWASCVANVPIPKNILPDDVVWVYVLKQNSTIVYLDDFEIDFLKKK